MHQTENANGVGSDTFRYKGLKILPKRKFLDGIQPFYEMSCEREYKNDAGEKKRILLAARGADFEKAKEAIIQKIDGFDRRMM